MASAPVSEVLASASTVDPDEFRARVRAFLADHASRHGWLRDAHGRPHRDDHAPDHERVERARRCLRLLFEADLGAITWPTRYGGLGLTNREQVIFNQEAAAYDLPLGMFIIGVGMCAPTIAAHGTDDQKDRWLPPLLRGEEIWCQLFSEPGAGSDLAAVRCAATLEGDEWVINGQKVWSSGAHHCAWGTLLVRTDPTSARHAGLTLLVVDMSLPGIDVRPLRQMSGTSRFNEVFFDDCRIPADSRLGEVGDGWKTAVTSLMNERVSIGTGTPGGYGHPVSALAAEARHAGVDDDPVVRDTLARLHTQEQIITWLGNRTTEALLAGRQPGPEGSLAKLASSQLAKDSAALAMSLVGPASVAWEPGNPDDAAWAAVQTSTPGLSIAGGTDEIMRNVIGERILGLPREPKPPTP